MKKQTTKQKVLKLLSEGMKPKDVAAKLKIKTQQVYTIKSDEKKRAYKKRQEILSGGVIRVIQPQISRYNTTRECVTDEALKKPKPGFIVTTPVVKKSFFQKLKEFFGA